MSEDATGLGDELFSLTTALRRVVRRRLREGLPGPRLRGAHVELLQAVELRPGTGVAAAAHSLHLAANSVSTLVNQLVELGLLERRTDPGDRRAAQLWLSESASTRMDTCRHARAELVGGGVESLTAAEREALERALPALRALAAAVDAKANAKVAAEIDAEGKP